MPGWRRVLSVLRPFLLGVCLAALAGVGPGPTAAAQSEQPASDEERLAAAYAPVLYVASQGAPCDRDGDPFVPAPVEVVLGDPAVAFEQTDDEPSLIRMGPTVADLFRRDDAHFLDYPGNPRRPGCAYEERFRARMGDQPAVAYARIIVDPEESRLALQYWFFYYFNDWNNTHEGDWEMIQLAFDAASAEEALGEEPVRAAYAQHANGETAAWDGDELRKEDGRPVVHVSEGSHASYFGDDVYLGYGEAGAGFGCDDASGPARRVPVEARLVPADVADQDAPAAWVAYDGRWGERERSFWNGPRGPNTKDRWEQPFAWQEGLRGTSIAVADRADRPGPHPVDVFCAVVGGGATFLNLFDLYPRLGYATIATALAAVVALFALARRPLGATAVLYLRHLPTFALIGAMLVPIGAVVNVLHLLVVALPPVEFVLRLMARSPTATAAQLLAVGGLQQLAVLLLIAPAVIVAVRDVRAGQPPDFERAYRDAWARVRAVSRAALPAVAIVFALAISVVGLPWAVRHAVRWFFVNQAVVLDGARAEGARTASARIVAGNWWRTLGAVVALALVGASVGPLLGVALMVFSATPVEVVGVLSGAVYAATVPFAVIGTTLLYEDLTTRGRPS